MRKDEVVKFKEWNGGEIPRDIWNYRLNSITGKPPVKNNTAGYRGIGECSVNSRHQNAFKNFQV